MAGQPKQNPHRRTDPDSMQRTEDYDYELPRELIAQHPLRQRTDARLMIIDRSTESIDHRHVRDLPEILGAGDSLVMNNSRVVAARMIGYRTGTGGRWQGLFLRQLPDSHHWEVLTKTRGKLKSGEAITVQDRDGRDGLKLNVIDRTDDGHLIVEPHVPEGHRDSAGDALQSNDPPYRLLARYGRVPIPPYIRDGHMVDADLTDYQTVFASRDGSVAAPTAGLHLTHPLLEKLRKQGVATAEVTLHVGIGTFRPIEATNLSDHRMHEETYEVDAETANLLNDRRERGRVIAVGSTSVRTLESVADEAGRIRPGTGGTDLFIRPPHSFRAVDAMMTNFHLPRSSLLVMVSAFAGIELTQQAYREAVDQEYRFFSYGDAMLIL